MARTTAARTTRRAQTALDLLKADHAEVKKLFRQFERLKKNEDTDGMQEVAQTVCDALRIHAQIEEEIFYPALREAGDAGDALDEADVEHRHVKELVEQIASSDPGEEAPVDVAALAGRQRTMQKRNGQRAKRQP